MPYIDGDFWFSFFVTNVFLSSEYLFLVAVFSEKNFIKNQPRLKVKCQILYKKISNSGFMFLRGTATDSVERNFDFRLIHFNFKNDCKDLLFIATDWSAKRRTWLITLGNLKYVIKISPLAPRRYFAFHFEFSQIRSNYALLYLQTIIIIKTQHRTISKTIFYIKLFKN